MRAEIELLFQFESGKRGAAGVRRSRSRGARRWRRGRRRWGGDLVGGSGPRAVFGVGQAQGVLGVT